MKDFSNLSQKSILKVRSNLLFFDFSSCAQVEGLKGTERERELSTWTLCQWRIESFGKRFDGFSCAELPIDELLRMNAADDGDNICSG